MAIQDKYPSIKPSLNLDFANSKTLDPRIDFTRASTATFYDGKTVAKAEENLLLNSATLATQSVITIATPYTLSFYGTGTVTLSGTSTAGPLVGTGVTDRVVLTFTPTAGTLTLTVSGTVEKAQLEARSVATAWTATTTQPITNYIPVLQTASANVPRFDHDPVTGESLGLLIEESRTNLLTRSEEFDNSVWIKSDTTVTANAVVAPDGTLTADRLIENTSNAVHIVSQILSLTSGKPYTFSFFVKPSGRDVIRGQIFSGSAIASVDFNITSGTIVSTVAGSGAITLVGNGWYRCSISGIATSTATYIMRFYPVVNDNASYTGDGTSGIYIWGAQLEAGAFPTSYIKTEASQVTRAADNAVMTGANFSSWFRQDEGTLFSSATRGWSSNPFQNRLFVLDDGSSANRMQIRVTGDGSIAGTVASSSTTQADLISGSARLFSAALAYKYNDFALVSNGGNVASDTSGVVPDGIARALIGGSSFDSPFSGHIRKIAYYPKRLSNDNLAAITK